MRYSITEAAVVFRYSEAMQMTDSHSTVYAARFMTALAMAAVVLLTGCAMTKPPVSCQQFDTAVVYGDFPRSVAVLPFLNLTDAEGIENMVRVNFYSHLSTLPYRDVELSTVDIRLQQLGILDQAALARVSVRKLGRILGCDAVVFGSIFEFQRVFAGLYSTMSVGAAIHVWDTRTGRKIWSDRYTARDHEGGVPLTLLDIPMITLRSGWNLRDATKITAVDELARELTANLPRPASPGDGNAPEGQYELQAGAFFEPDRAQWFKNILKRRGYPAFIRQNNDERGVWHRVLIGPYTNREKALQVRNEIQKTMGAECFMSLKNS